MDEYIANTLYGTKPDVAKPPLRSLQVDDQIRMTMYFYCQTPGNCTSANGHWPYAYPEQDKCSMPVGGPIWCVVAACRCGKRGRATAPASTICATRARRGAAAACLLAHV